MKRPIYKGNFQEFSRYRYLGSGHDAEGSSHPGISRDGIGSDIVSTVLHGMGLRHHGIARDTANTVLHETRDSTRRGTHGSTSRGGIDASRDCTARDYIGEVQRYRQHQAAPQELRLRSCGSSRISRTIRHRLRFFGQRWLNLNHATRRHAIASRCPGSTYDVLPLSSQNRRCIPCAVPLTTGTAVRFISYVFIFSHRDSFCLVFSLFCDHR